MTVFATNRMTATQYLAEVKGGAIHETLEAPGRRPPSPRPEQRAQRTDALPAGGKPVTIPGAKKGSRTFAAVPAEGPDGMGGTRRYLSKKEAATARRLEQEREIGGIDRFLPQVGVIVGKMGDRNVRHFVDFLVIVEIRPDGTFLGKWVESKGWDENRGRQKRLALERLSGCKVEVV